MAARRIIESGVVLILAALALDAAAGLIRWVEKRKPKLLARWWAKQAASLSL